MDDLLSKLLSFPPHPPPQVPLTDAQYDEAIKAQIAAVSKMSDSKLTAQTASGENALDVIDPALNTVAYTYILLAHVNQLRKDNSTDLTEIFEKLIYFLENFDGRQIRYLGKKLEEIIGTTSDMARNGRQLDRAIGPIASAILRVDPTGSMLTSAHLFLVKLSLESRQFLPVVPVIDKSILYFPGNPNQPKAKYLCEMDLSPSAYITPTSNLTDKFKHQQVLEYFIYSGMINIGLQRWAAARECLENAITYPSKEQAVSKIMVEAYKKWVLVGILLEGRLLPLPKSTSGAAARVFHIIAKPYEAVAQVFETARAPRVRGEVEVGQKFWREDCNVGLMKNVLNAFQKFQIRNLANTYSKITIPEVHSMTQSAETGEKLPSMQAVEQLVQSMIAEGSLNATLSHPTKGAAILTFASSGTESSETQMQQELAASTERIKLLTQEIKHTDRILTHDTHYLNYARKLKKNSQNASGDQGIAGPDMDWNDEEELMTGVDF